MELELTTVEEEIKDVIDGFQIYPFPSEVLKNELVSIHKNGSVYISKYLTTKYFLTAKYVIFYYDRANKKIGLKPAKSSGTMAIKLKGPLTAKGHGIVFGATKILQYFDIPFNASQSFDASWDAVNQMLVVDLNKAVNIY